MLSKLGPDDSQRTCIGVLLNQMRRLEKEYFDHVIDCWRGNGVFMVDKWDNPMEGNWALYIDMGKLRGVEGLYKEGEQAIIPFPWASLNMPTINDAVNIFRTMTVTYNDK